jgi:hypothetical protein
MRRKRPRRGRRGEGAPSCREATLERSRAAQGESSYILNGATNFSSFLGNFATADALVADQNNEYAVR